MSATTQQDQTCQCEAWLAEDELYSQLQGITVREPSLFVTLYMLIRCEEPVTIYRYILSRDGAILSENLIRDTLASAQIPLRVRPITIQRIRECAREASDKNSFVAGMGLYVWTTEAANVSEVPGESVDSQVLGLEKVIAEDSTSLCVICLEDILVGTEAARMPCSHVYHGSCITEWLQTSIVRPLCRFEMPVSC